MSAAMTDHRSSLIAVVVVLAALVLVAAARRRDDRPRHRCSCRRETRKRDQSASATLEAAGRRGREVEQAGRARAPRRPQIEPAAGVRAAPPYVPPDPEQLGVTRRQFLNRGIVTFIGAEPRRLRRRRCSPSCGRVPKGGFGSKINVGKIADILSRDQRRRAASSTSPEGRSGSPSTRPRRCQKAEKVVLASRCSTGMEAGIVVALPEVPAPRLPRAACVTSQWFECPCHGSQYNQVGEKKGGPAPRGMDRFADDGQRRHAHRRHRHRSSRARRSAPTPPAKRPKVRTASAAVMRH